MTIRCSLSDGVARLVIDRPAALNAISAAMLDELAAALQALAGDARVRCLVLTGAGANFSSGADIKEPLPDLAALVEEPVAGHPALLLRAFPQPSFAAIRGYCLGGGLELALAADFRIAEQGATFGFAEIDWALTTGWGGAGLLRDCAGRAAALRLLLTGERFDADEARRMGIVCEVHAPDAFEARIDDLARRLAAAPAGAAQALRALLADDGFAERLRRERAAFAATAALPEAQARLADFAGRPGP